MKYFLIALLLTFSTMSQAKTDIPGWNDLSDVQKAEIKLKAAQNAESIATGPVTPEDVPGSRVPDHQRLQEFHLKHNL